MICTQCKLAQNIEFQITNMCYSNIINIIVLRTLFVRYSVFMMFTLLITVKISYSQESDTLRFREMERSSLSFWLDDTYLIGGVNYGGVYYSKQFRNLHYMPGFNLGIEQYIPLTGKMLLSTGLLYSQRNFLHEPAGERVALMNHFLDIPLSGSFVLPVLRDFDFRIIFGANLGFRLASNRVGSYSEDYDGFEYKVSNFQAMDFGWVFGFSAEYRNVMLRFRCLSGFARIDGTDQGMLNTLNLELGYYLFRRKR
jgi:hypothetical protein